MAVSRPAMIALGVAGGFAVAMPTILLWPGERGTSAVDARIDRPVTSLPLPAIGSVYERPVFAPADAVDAVPNDAPALVGIAGRLNRDAVAMVRVADGNARSLAVGESVDGWRLESLAIDAAFFTRGRERVRVAMNATDSEVAPLDQ